MSLPADINLMSCWTLRTEDTFVEEVVGVGSWSTPRRQGKVWTSRLSAMSQNASARCPLAGSQQEQSH